MTLEELQKAITNLPPKEQNQFRIWYDQFEANAWDQQIENDAATGRLDAMAEEATVAHRAGKSKKL